MIAVWIIASVFTVVGGLYSLPKYYKILSCKACTTGQIIESRNSLGHNNSAKAIYEYYVDGIRYTASTGWSNFAHFSHKREYKVRYNPKNPNISFINMSGIYINAVLGTIFLVVGIGAFILGIFLSTVIL